MAELVDAAQAAVGAGERVDRAAGLHGAEALARHADRDIADAVVIEVAGSEGRAEAVIGLGHALDAGRALGEVLVRRGEALGGLAVQHADGARVDLSVDLLSGYADDQVVGAVPGEVDGLERAAERLADRRPALDAGAVARPDAVAARAQAAVRADDDVARAGRVVARERVSVGAPVAMSSRPSPSKSRGPGSPRAASAASSARRPRPARPSTRSGCGWTPCATGPPPPNGRASTPASSASDSGRPARLRPLDAEARDTGGQRLARDVGPEHPSVEQCAITAATARSGRSPPRATRHAPGVVGEGAHPLASGTPADPERFSAVGGEPTPEGSAAPDAAIDMERMARAAVAAGVELLGPPPFDRI